MNLINMSEKIEDAMLIVGFFIGLANNFEGNGMDNMFA